MKNLVASSVIALWALVPVAQAANLFEETNFQSLVEDQRAHKVGDQLTVLIIEQASAEARTGSSAERDFGFNASIRTGGFEGPAALGAGRQDGSSGVVQRSGKLRAQVSAQITQVLPNGDLVLKGYQRIQVNDEEQEINLSGSIRSEDVSATNVVVSNRIRNMNLVYSGEGFLADNEKPGWISRFFQFLGL